MTTLKTTFLRALLTVLLVTAGGAMGGEGGMMLAFLFALVMNGVSYWFSDKIVLRMYGAKEISADEVPTLHRIIRDLTLRAQMPMPKPYLIPQEPRMLLPRAETRSTPPWRLRKVFLMDYPSLENLP